MSAFRGKRSLYPIWRGSWRFRRFQQEAAPTGWDESSWESLNIWSRMADHQWQWMLKNGLVECFFTKTCLVCVASRPGLSGNPLWSLVWTHLVVRQARSYSSTCCQDFQLQSPCHVSENPAVQQLTKNGCLGKTRSTNLFQSIGLLLSFK